MGGSILFSVDIVAILFNTESSSFTKEERRCTMAPRRNSYELAWVPEVDPNKVYDILVQHAGACDDAFMRQGFVSSWLEGGWFEWRFGGSLGHGGKIWRERICIPNDFSAPNLRVSCYNEHRNAVTLAAIEATDKALLELLVSVGLRKAE